MLSTSCGGGGWKSLVLRMNMKTKLFMAFLKIKYIFGLHFYEVIHKLCHIKNYDQALS
jgi:hypothetical protein